MGRRSTASVPLKTNLQKPNDEDARFAA